MAPAIQASHQVCFGEFQLDLQTAELRYNGNKLTLQDQPFQVLALLLERPGQLVTRDELKKRLWPSDTFVDFDRGLNKAVNRLREVLGDSAENPRFIETLPRHGYRFIGSLNGAEKTPVMGAKPARLRRRLGFSVAFGLLATIGIAAALLGLNVYHWRDRLSIRAEKPRIQALAVLPLANLSGDPEQEYFADGMTEVLISELGKISSPRVISRQSVIQYKGSKKPLQEIARELNVDAVLEGTVERAGDQIRVIVHLDQVSPDGQLWSSQYNRDIRDMLRLQDEIARTVTDEIRVKLKPQEYARRAGSRLVNPEVQDDYFRALHFRNKGAVTAYYNEQDLLAAISYFKQAIEKDPQYAPAYAGMADAYIELGNPWSGSHPAKETQHRQRGDFQGAYRIRSCGPHRKECAKVHRVASAHKARWTRWLVTPG